MKVINPAERLLKSLGVTEPAEIDLEAIAYDQGAEVRYCNLCGCEADILGYKNRAIISVDENKAPQRKRFSIAHELGHWHYHRGKRLQCRIEEYQPKQKIQAERVANGYAASLLLPHYLVLPRARDRKQLNFKVIEEFARDFHTSLPATAIRLVEADIWPCMLVCHTRTGRRWFTQAPMFHRRWFPRDELDAQSSAFDTLFGKSEGGSVRQLIGADAWFDRNEAQRYEIFEQAKRINSDEVLVLLTIKDNKMIEEEPEWSNRRRY
ncbi:ImmA/IrrE family metallo-endopeptidase [Rhizobium sp. L1K21]|uniref:ImmA/IrrE family metallo-endopeptidase n=1 Tax=Rhizobium sp. L1K21 TaxID=2954933 RepID=UPI00209335BD|nr:ImmA/IrrE family metallo-endopeptidase [Rhizobium sp. L1K21]MCO6185226.1 ImmA/IrrE family metallo-endopeptidase [Rhizobium sp. L1K21]